MARPAEFEEQNDWFTPAEGPAYPIWISDTTLDKKTVKQSISAWQMSLDELAYCQQNDHIVFLAVIGGQPPCEILGGDPVPFEGMTANYTHADCRNLPTLVRSVIYLGQPTHIVVSAWQLRADQIHRTTENGGMVFLRLIGGQQNVAVSGFNLVETFSKTGKDPTKTH